MLEVSQLAWFENSSHGCFERRGRRSFSSRIPTMENKKLNYSIAKYLKAVQGGLSGEKQESLSVAIESLEDVFEVDDTQAGALDSGVDLVELFKSAQPTAHAAAPAPAQPAQPSAEDVAKADTLKGEGNAYMSAQKYQEAVDAYTQAITLHPTNKILYSCVDCF